MDFNDFLFNFFFVFPFISLQINTRRREVIINIFLLIISLIKRYWNRVILEIILSLSYTLIFPIFIAWINVVYVENVRWKMSRESKEITMIRLPYWLVLEVRIQDYFIDLRIGNFFIYRTKLKLLGATWIGAIFSSNIGFTALNTYKQR